MKRLFTLLMVFVMVCSFSAAVMGEREEGGSEPLVYDKEEIEEVARRLFDLSSDYVMDHSEFREDRTTERIDWFIYFYKIDDDQYFNCSFDAKTADLKSFEKANRNNTGILTVTEEEAKEEAVFCIEKYNPGLMNTLIEAKSSDVSFLNQGFVSKNSYYFTFFQVIEGVVFPANYITVQISGYDKNVISYRKEWSDWTYEKKGSFLSDDAVLSKFRAKDIIKPEYIKKTDQDSDSVVLTPVYRLLYGENESGFLTATDGRFLSSDELFQDGSVIKTPVLEDTSAKESLDGRGSYSTIPEKGVISAEEAELFIREKLSFLKDIKELVVLSTEYTSMVDGVKGKYWRIYFYSEYGSSLSVVMDGVQKRMISVSYSRPSEPVKPYRTEPSDDPVSQVTSFKEKDLLEDRVLLSGDMRKSNESLLKEELTVLLKNVFPELDQNQVNLDQFESDPKTGMDTYWGYRSIDEIPYKKDRVQFTVDTGSNEIVRFRLHWTYDVNVLYQGVIVPLTQSQNIYFKAAGFDLTYVRLKDQTREAYVNVPDPELVPVYSLKQTDFVYVSAVNGDLLDNYGVPIKEKLDQGKFEDISGHIHERAILLMSRMGYLDEQNQFFRPDDMLLKKDLVKWLGNAFYDNSNYILGGSSSLSASFVIFYDYTLDHDDFASIVKAVRVGILSKDERMLQPEKRITVLDMSKFVIRGLGLKHLAETPGLFRFDPSIPEELQKDSGAIALAKAYGIIHPDEQSYDRTLTRGKGVQILYDLLIFLRNIK